MTLTGSTSALASSTRPVITASVADSVTGTVYSSTATATLSVSHVAATITLHPAASKVTMVQGQSGTLQITTTTGGSFAGAVKLAATGLPTGVTATWTGSPFTANSTGTATSTLTLKAATSAAAATANFIITATGDGVAAQTTVSVQVTPAPAIKLALSTASVSMKSNTSQSITLTVGSVGGAQLPANPPASSFQITGLPTGITAAWGTPVRSSTGALQVNLTIQGSSTAVSTTTKPTITVNLTDAASAAAYSATEQLNLAVTRSSLISN